ncbi:Auxin-responsive protein IAA27 [Heracleum sosnowskyi]|uniref:Auxin-responsive protein n=1 Tax=Heracleum sosnowskyi TaxID=360622 RepID=A0AAD8I4Z1_9APIA|nr:Auxin-responsive protein IAA27 [Heracleum sosnowskyi]
MPLQEHDYIGLSEVSSKESSDKNEKNINKGLNLKATELRLGLPGSESPERENGVCLKNVGLVSSGAKRVFSDTVNGGSGKWSLVNNGGSEVGLVHNGVLFSPRSVNAGKIVGESNDIQSAVLGSSAEKVVERKPQISAAKAKVVGWPPIRSFRKNTMAINPPKNDNNVDAKSGSSCIYVKVSMDGAPYLRKVDLTMYDSYTELSLGLKKMFSCFTIGQCGSHVIPAQDALSEGRLMDLLPGSESVLTYEDKDGDWMLVGDVPWDMFIETCKRMRIMKSSDAVGLGREKAQRP